MNLKQVRHHLIPNGALIVLLLIPFWMSTALNFARAGDPPHETFDTIVERFSNNPSDQDRPKLREAALKSMSHAFLYNDLPEPTILESDWQSEDEFRNRMSVLWNILARAIGKDEPYPIKLLRNFRDKLEEILRWGMIPIPNIEHDEQYRYTYLRKYFPLGISPIPVEKYTNKGLASRQEHPIRTYFLESRLSLLEHDFQHARFLANVQNSLGITTIQKRQRLLDCFQSVPGESDVKSPVRLSNYYLLHEDLHSLLPGHSLLDSLSVRGYSEYSFVEFALEKTLSKNGLSLQTLLEGKALSPELSQDSSQVTSRDAARKKTCSALDKMDALEFEQLIPRKAFNEKLNQYLGLPKVSNSMREDLYSEMLSGIRTKLLQLCFGLPAQMGTIPDSATSADIAQGLAILKANIQAASRKETGEIFSVAFFEEMRKLQEGVDFVMDYIRLPTNQACAEFKFPPIPPRTSPNFIYYQFPEMAPYLDVLPSGFEKVVHDQNYIALDKIIKTGRDLRIVFQALPNSMLEDPEIQMRIRKYLTSADPKDIPTPLIQGIFSQPFAAGWDDELYKLIPSLYYAGFRRGITTLFSGSPQNTWKKSFRELLEIANKHGDPTTLSNLIFVFKYSGFETWKSELEYLIEISNLTQLKSILENVLVPNHSKWGPEIKVVQDRIKKLMKYETRILKLDGDFATFLEELPVSMLGDPEIQAQIHKFIAAAPGKISVPLIQKIFSQPFAADWDDELTKLIWPHNTADERRDIAVLFGPPTQHNWKKSFRELAGMAAKHSDPSTISNLMHVFKNPGLDTWKPELEYLIEVSTIYELGHLLQYILTPNESKWGPEIKMAQDRIKELAANKAELGTIIYNDYINKLLSGPPTSCP